MSSDNVADNFCLALKPVVQKCVSNFIEEFTRVLSEKYSIDQAEILDVYNQLVPVSERITSETNIINSPTNKEKKVCQHQITMGINRGKKCGKNVSKNSVSGKYCTAHIKHEQVIEKKIETKVEVKTSDEKVIKKFKPRMNRSLGNVYHDVESGFIIDRAASKKIYARVRDEKITPLIDSDIADIKKLEQEYDMDLFSKFYPDE